MSLSSLTTLPRRLASTAVGAATHPVSTVARGIGLARGTATGLAHAVQAVRGSDSGQTATGEPEPAPAPTAASTVADRTPPPPVPDPTPDPERTAPGSVARPEPDRGYQHTPEPEPEVVYSTTTPDGAEPGAADEDTEGGLLDAGTAHAVEAEADTLRRAADPRPGD